MHGLISGAIAANKAMPPLDRSNITFEDLGSHAFTGLTISGHGRDICDRGKRRLPCVAGFTIARVRLQAEELL